MKAKADAELEKYRAMLEELWDSRAMSLAEGMLAGFCIVGIFTKGEGKAWQEKLFVTQRARHRAHEISKR